MEEGLEDSSVMTLASIVDGDLDHTSTEADNANFARLRGPAS